MNRIRILILAIILLMSFTSNVVAVSSIKVIVDGKELNFDVQPIIQNERVLVPMRAIFEKLNAEVQWDSNNKLVTGLKEDVRIELIIDKNIAKINETTIILDSPATIINGRTLVPIRFIAESLGCEVKWDGSNRTVNIESKGNVKENIANYLSLNEIIKGVWYWTDDSSAIIEFTDNEFKLGWAESEWDAMWTYEINSVNEKDNTLQITVTKDYGQKEEYTVKLYSIAEDRPSLHLIDSNGRDTMWIKMLY